jgi:PPK2 family polyphosphate:nucleotide phosphotransferase
MKEYRVKPGTKLKLARFDPDDAGGYKSSEAGKARARAATAEFIAKLGTLQERLYAGASRAVLIVLQGMDTSGKDGTIKNVMSGVNPQGCRVATFKVPTSLERAHDFLWRVHREVPAKGHIGIFNRSHYEDVLVTRVHGDLSGREVKQRWRRINEFEALLHESGTRVLKFFLHISKDEQRERLQKRIQNPEKRWKFNVGDLEERKLWDRYMTAFEDVISATGTDYAPWYIVPANRKWYRDLVVAGTVVGALEEMKLAYPEPPADIDFDKLTID